MSATGRSGWPGDDSVASRPSERETVTSPSLVVSTTEVMPGPSELPRVTSHLSRSASQAESRSALGLTRSAVTDAESTLPDCWSMAAASRARQPVIRVQARSVLPGA